MFYTLHKAIDKVTLDKVIIAEDISAAGQKQFYVGSLLRLKNIYTTKKEHHWYECLLENRPSRLFLDIESDTAVSIDEIVDFFAQAIQIAYQKTCKIEIIDSSSKNKISYHLIVPELVFKNVYHVGAFVRRTVLAMQDNPIANAIDTAVYTKNRMFRLVGSRKFNSQRVLKHTKPWWELLVQTECETPLECLEINNSEPKSTSIHPKNLFQRLENGKWAIARQQTGSCVKMSCNPLNPILDWLDSKENAMTIRSKLKMISSGFYCVPAKSKKCGIAGRTHKGNAIWFMLDVTRQQIIQRCLDSDCGYKKHLIEHPPQIWDRWTLSWMMTEPTPNNQNTLYNMSY